MSSSSVWVQLYYEGKDEPVGNCIFIKTASLDPPVIAALVKQVMKEELKKELDHAGLTEIDVYPHGTTPPFLQDKALDPGDDVPPSTTSKNPLIVVAPALSPSQQPQQTPPSSPSSGKIPSSVLDLLERFKGKPLTTSEIDYALIEFPQYVTEITNASTEIKRENLANSLWIRLSLRIRTRTRLLLREQYLFDGPVPRATTGLGTEIHFVLKGSSLFCAKIMQNVDALQREYDTALRIHAGQLCPTVMPVIDFIKIPGETSRAAMITPYYPLALVVTDNGLLCLEGSINAALCGLATLKAFSVKNLCHGDIKPANMMFCASAKIVVTIDFGSACLYGENLTSITPQFGLNHSLTASLEYDLTCLATSLFVLTTGKSPPDTIQQLKNILASELQVKMHPTLQIAQWCLVSKVDDIDEIWKGARGCVDKYLPHLDQELLVLYDDIWPVAR